MAVVEPAVYGERFTGQAVRLWCSARLHCGKKQGRSLFFSSEIKKMK